MFDVVVVGGGVIGGAILRELTKYKLSVCMVEKESDVCMGESKANSGIVHAGFDAAVGSLKAKFNVIGNKMMYSYANDLGVKCINNGSLVIAYSEQELETLNDLKMRGEENGVEGLEILDKQTLLALEPNISDKAFGALRAATGGIVCPYELTIASIGNAMDNGAKLITEFEVCSIRKNDDVFILTDTDGRTIDAKIVINCAGINSGKISALAGDDTIKIGGRKGEYILLDRESGDFVKHTVFCCPTEKGKGILVSPTVDGNIILGPTAKETDEHITYTTNEGLEEVKNKAQEMTKNLPLYNAITSFAGIRAYSSEHDFIIEQSSKVKGLINCAGIESPGLTSAPAIAKYVVEDIVSSITPLVKNSKFNGKRTPDYFFKNLTVEQKNELIKKDSSYGKMVCRCEQITEGEILHAIRVNPKATTVDAVKRRTRAGMGRCQGGFCQIHVAEIIAKELGISFDKVLKSGKNTELVVGKTK